MATKMQLQHLYGYKISKDQLKIGSILHYYGKDAPNTRWQVGNIAYKYKKKIYYHDSVHTLNDEIYLKCMNRCYLKFISFRHISKSLLWRL